jgi:hypothetical protein
MISVSMILENIFGRCGDDPFGAVQETFIERIDERA